MIKKVFNNIHAISLAEWCRYPNTWWLSLIWIEFGNLDFFLLHIERKAGGWKFDFLFMGELVRLIKDKIEERNIQRSTGL